MSQDTLCLLGAASVVLLLASAAYLWRLLRDIPVSRRVVNMLNAGESDHPCDLRVCSEAIL